jgi:hypothetical protein
VEILIAQAIFAACHVLNNIMQPSNLLGLINFGGIPEWAAGSQRHNSGVDAIQVTEVRLPGLVRLSGMDRAGELEGIGLSPAQGREDQLPPSRA